MLQSIWIVDHSSGQGYSVRYEYTDMLSIHCGNYATLYEVLKDMHNHSVRIVDMTIGGYDE